MGIEQAHFLANSTLWLLFVLSLPPLIFTTFVSLFFSIFQAVTQIQDQVLPFAAKFGTIIAVLTVSGAWMYDQIADLFLTALALLDQPIQPF